MDRVKRPGGCFFAPQFDASFFKALGDIQPSAWDDTFLEINKFFFDISVKSVQNIC